MSRCVLDTDVVIAALDRGDEHHARAARAIKVMPASEVTLLLSLVNYAETLMRPAEDDRTLQIARDALTAIGIRLVAPTSTIAVNAARHCSLNVTLADGFALATAEAHDAKVASFDQRVRRAASKLGLELAP